jgi:hypothetical protein
MLESFAAWRSVRFSEFFHSANCALQILRGDLTRTARVLADLAADLVWRVGGEHHDLKWVAGRRQKPVGDRHGDPAGHVT